MGSLVAVLVAILADSLKAPPRPAGFTAAKAKQALIGLMDTRTKAPVQQDDIKKFGDEAAVVDDGNLGVAYWGPFTLDLVAMRYRFMVGSEKPPVWFNAFEGEFELRGDKWIARPPRLTACGIGGR